MNALKLLAATTLLAFTGSAFAGIDDWTGTFTLADATGKTYVFTHNPGSLVVKFGDVVYCTNSFYPFAKGTCLSTLCAKESGSFLTNMSVEQFEFEVKKLDGQLIEKTIKLGNTYP